MPTLSAQEATETLARALAQVGPSTLGEIRAELFPEEPTSAPAEAADLARHIRGGLEAEEIVDLWNVVFPEDRNVRYDEETGAIRYNEELAGYVD